MKFLHLIFGTTFFGIMIAAFFYITRSIKHNDSALIHYSLKASYFGDSIIFFIVLIQLVTASQLISSAHLALSLPWIIVAYHAFGILILIWLSLLLIKLLYLSKSNIRPIYLKLFYFLNTLMIIIFIMIIHDAVTQSTWFHS